MQPRNIQQVRVELRIWGQFWYSQEQIRGYARRSACDKLLESIKKYDSAAISSEVTYPPIVLQYDRLIDNLTPECRRALRACYVCRQVHRESDAGRRNNWAMVGFSSFREYEYWLRRAEMELL